LHVQETASTESKLKHATNRQRGGYAFELENWLQNNASLMGERSNLPGLIAAIERGVNAGNSGTKGVGMVRIEPFTQCSCATHLPGESRVTGLRYSCPTCSFGAVADKFDRSDRCWAAWRGLTDYERDLLAARYVFTSRKLPAGIQGQLGDLAAVAYVVADRLGLLERIIQDSIRQRWRQWESVCAMALEEAHRGWRESRADADEASGKKSDDSVGESR
jgi:hypothetical protein